MTRSLLLFLPTVLLIAADAPKKPAKDDLQGTWVVVAKESKKNGKPLKPELLNKLTITFSGRKIILKVGDESQEGTFALHKTAKPKGITITPSDGKTPPVRGIYRIEEGTLWLCFAQPGEKAPTRFAARKGSKCDLLVLQRQ